MLTNRWTGTALLILALFAVITLQTHRLATERRRAATLAPSASNLVAERDSTRNLAVETEAVSHLLGDSLQAFGKLVIQTTQQRDALDAALGTERMAKYAMALHVDTLNAAAPLVASDTIKHRYHFAIREEPYTADADVGLPVPPDTARLRLRVSLDPISLIAQVECAAADADGIRAASIVTSTPRWASVTFQRVEQSSGVCASPALIHSLQGKFEFAPVVIGAGRIGTANGAGWGVFVGTGIRWRP